MGKAGRRLIAGTMVDHFKVMRLIGRGGMGEVYLARDTKLGRRTALKIVGSRHLQSPDALESFRREAMTTAKFNHPNIVTLHAVGEYEGRPYVALEYLEGQDLASRIEERQPSLSEALRIGLAIASALAEAHSHGVLHLDLKPGNVVIGGDGRPRVVDFGLAKTIHAGADGPADPTSGDDSGEVFGTPAYTSPERWRAQPATVATDIWALGVIVFELCAHRLPFSAKSSTATRDEILSDTLSPRLDEAVDVPRELAELVATCLEKEPNNRPTAAEAATVLETMLGGRGPEEREEECPFRGLLPFDQRHADVFFGRDAEIDAFVERLRHTPVLPVVGPPGAGKSSFVHAGVVPRLREQEAWVVLHVRPGARPFANLADRLRRRETLSFARSGEIVTAERTQVEGPRSVARSGEVSGRYDIVPLPDRFDDAERLEERPRRLSLALRAIADDEHTKVLLVVDRLEDLFTMVDDPGTRRRFIEAICTAADDPLDPVRVVFTVRDDLLGRLSFSPQVRNVLGHVTVVQRLDELALRETMRRPVEALGYRYEDPELVRDMVAAVAGEPSCLPMLQFAGQMLWEHRDEKHRVLLRSAYEEMGGVEGALARHADSVLAGFTDDEVQIARDILLKLVTPERTRRVVPLGPLSAELSHQGESVLARLMESRLVSVRRVREASHSRSRIELAHESLVTGWETLTRWIDETRDDLAFVAEAGTAAELWEQRGCLPQELWRGDALASAQRRRARLTTDVPGHIARFLDASHDAQDAHERRRQLRLASSIGALAVVAAAAVGVSVYVSGKEREARRDRVEAERQREEASKHREHAEQQHAEALRESARAAAGAGRSLEARAKLRLALEFGDNTTARALWWNLEAEPVLWQAELGTFGIAVDASPDGSIVAAGCHDSAICLYDLDTRAMLVLRGHREKVSSLAFSHNGRYLAAGDWSSDIVLWNVETGRPERMLRGHGERVMALDFSPDDTRLVSAGRDQTVRLWDVESGAPGLQMTGHDGGIEGLSFHPSGKQIASASEDGTVRVWSAATGKNVRTISVGAPAEDVAFNAEGDLLAAACTDSTVRLWGAKTGKAIATLRAHTGGVRAVAFAPDEPKLVTGSYDNTIRIWDLEGRTVERVFRGHTGSVRDVAVARAGRMLVSTGYDDTLRVWNVRAAARPAIAEGHAGATRGLAWNSAGTLLASGGFDRTVRIWNAETGEPTSVLTGHDGAVYGVSFGPDGDLVASASADATVRVWDVHTGREVQVLQGHAGAVYSVGFSPDGGHLVSSSRDQTVRLWSLATGEALRTLTGHDNVVWDVRFDIAGERIAAASWDRTARVWDAASGKLLRALTGHEGAVYGAAFAPDSRRVATTSADGTVRLWSLADGAHDIVARIPGRGGVLSFHPDGHRLAVPVSDGSIHLVDATSDAVAIVRGHSAQTTVAAFSPNGKRFASTADDGNVRVWDIKAGRPSWRAPLLMTRPARLLSHQGWTAIDEGIEDLPQARWRKAVEQGARFAEQSLSGDQLCIHAHDGEVQLWDLGKDELVAHAPVPDLQQLRTHAQGCVVRSAAGVSLVKAPAATTLAEEPAEAIGVGGDAILIARAEDLVVVDAAGTIRSTHPTGVGVSAVTRGDDFLVVGYQDGTIEATRNGDSDREATDFFERIPAGPVTRLALGPRDTLIAGYANGSVAMWNLIDGVRLRYARLHGPVVHLMIDGQKLYAATALGRSLVWDLEVFSREYCDVVHDVWAAVPVSWNAGRPMPLPPPSGHPCRE